MKRHLILFFAAAAAAAALVACHTDSAVAPDTTPAIVPGDVKNMSVGEVRVLTPAQVQNGLEFSGGAAANDYLVVVANTNPTPDVTATYAVRGNYLDGDLPHRGLVAEAPFQVGAEVDLQGAFEGRLRRFERSQLLPYRSALFRSDIGLRSAISAAVVPPVGQTMSLKVPNGDAETNKGSLCDNFINTTGTVKAVSNHAIIVLDNAADQNTFTTLDFNGIANEFDNIDFPTDSSYFGNPTDVDDNNRHVILYYTPEVNKLTPPNQSSFIGGFFFAGDFFLTTGTNACAESNRAEIFYLLAPDPTGKVNNNVRTTEQVRQGTRGTVAHEFQHMINAGNRIKSQASAFESVWLDEGLAHFAEDAVGRAFRGFGDTQTLADVDLFKTGDTAIVNAYNAFFFQNLKRFQRWLQRPDTSSGISKNADQNLSSRGAIWALLRWTADNYATSDVRALTRKLVAGPDTGVTNLTAKSGAPLDSLMAGWLVANYADTLNIANLASKYRYKSYKMRNVEMAINTGVYPLQVTTLTSGAIVSAASLSGSGTYYRVNVPAGGARTVTVQPSFTGAHFYVLRID